MQPSIRLRLIPIMWNRDTSFRSRKGIGKRDSIDEKGQFLLSTKQTNGSLESENKITITNGSPCRLKRTNLMDSLEK